jgi:molybdenum-dependent DNA-binding transcriptional regulator ModE
MEEEAEKMMYGTPAIKKIFKMTTIEWLTKSLFEAGVDRAMVCGDVDKMKLVIANCKKLFAEFVRNPRKSPRFLSLGLEYAKAHAERIVILSSDYAFTNPGTFRLLFEADAPIAVATCGGVRSEVLAVNTDLLEKAIFHCDLSALFEKAVEIECGDVGVISDVSKPETDLQSLYENCELNRTLRPITRYCLSLEDNFFGPGTVQTFRLISEQAAVKKAIDIMGMGYPTYIVMRERLEKALGFEPVLSAGPNKMTEKMVVRKETLEFIDRYERYVKAAEKMNRELFEEFFGDYDINAHKDKRKTTDKK